MINEGRQLELYKAVKNNDINLVKELVRAGCHVNQRDKDGNTPLHLAVLGGNHDIVDYLIRRGADLTKRIQPFGYTAIHIAAINNELKCMKYLVHELQRRQHSLTKHLATSGDNCLILACVNNSMDVAKYLIKKKVDINYIGSDDRNALEWSVKNRRFDAVELLVANNCDIHRNSGRHKSVMEKAKSLPLLRDAIARGKKLLMEKSLH